MTGTTATKPYESLPQPNEAKPITIDTFSWWPVQVARIQHFNGVKNDIQIMAVYGHLLGWKKTTGEIRPSQQYIADCCCMGLSTVQKTVKKLVAMGWITATTVRRPGSKEISHTIYTVKEPEKIMMEYNAAAITQGDAVVKVVKNQKQKSEGSKNDGKSESKEQQPVAVESSKAGTGKSEFFQHVASDWGDDVSPDDEVSEEEYPVFPVPKAEPEQSPAVQTEPERADFINLEYWFHGGEEDREEYGRQWGKTKPGEITDLIHSHYRAAQKDKEKNRGFKSAANDEQPGADVRYRQQQEQNLAASRPANGFSTQDLNQIPY